MSKNITIDLSDRNSIGEAIRLLTQSEPKKMKKDVRKFIDKMVSTGVDTAKKLVAERCTIDSKGELAASIHGEVIADNDTYIGVINTSNKHATYVEYGTGVVGMNSPHPTASEDGWAYDVNGHGDKGWTYPKDGKYKHTRGQTAKRFMYDTAKILEDKAVDIAKEVIGSDR